MSERDTEAQVVLIGRAPDGLVTFGNPVAATDGSGHTLSVVVEARGLTASGTLELESWGGAAAALIDYFADMAAGWRGWVGTRDWHDDSATLKLSATHDGIGTISLRVFLGWGEVSGTWRLEAVVPVDAGSLDATVAGLRRMLA